MAIVLAGCLDHEHLMRHNAPGNVDLSTPMLHENGDPKRYELPMDPGETTLIAVAAPYFLWGHGRLDASGASREAGMELRFERFASDGLGRKDPAHNAALTVGYGFAQYGDGRRTDAPGALYVEAGYRTLSGEFPVDAGLGPAYDLDARHLGGQLTLRIPLVMLRTRYVDGDGWQVMAGLEVPVWFFAGTWSH